jgi:hypothetical protein
MDATAFAPESWVRTLAFAAAFAAVAEVALHRVVAPVVAHIPGVPGGSAMAETLRLGGDMSLGATAVLVPLTGVAVAVALARNGGRFYLWLLAAVVATLAHATMSSSVFSLASYAILLATLGGVMLMATRGLTRLHATALVAACCGFLAGMWPLVIDELQVAGIAVGSDLAPGIAASTQTIAEAGLVVALVLFGVVAARSGTLEKVSWWVAAGVGAAAAVALASQPGYAAILSLWVAGITLALPPLTYVAAAASFGLVLAHWIRSPETRHLAAGVVLLVAAGIAPVMVHHNLTAIVGLALLATPAIIAERPGGPPGLPLGRPARTASNQEG